MLFRADPDMPIAPLAQLTQFLDFGVCVLNIILNWEFIRIKDPHIAAKTKEDS